MIEPNVSVDNACCLFTQLLKPVSDHLYVLVNTYAWIRIHQHIHPYLAFNKYTAIVVTRRLSAKACDKFAAEK